MESDLYKQSLWKMGISCIDKEAKTQYFRKREQNYSRNVKQARHYSQGSYPAQVTPDENTVCICSAGRQGMKPSQS